MSTDESDDDDAWADDEDDDFDEAESAACPECGAPVYSVTDKCPNCGFWLTDADRRAMWSGTSKPLWLRVTAAIVLLAFLFSLLGIGFSLF